MEFNTFLTTLALPDGAPSVDPASFFAQLARRRDPRHRRGQRYPLAVILTWMILAKLAGETTPSGSAHWARLRRAWLCAVLHLRRRPLPSATTSTLIAAKVDVADLNRRLAQFFVPPLPPPLPPAPAAAPGERVGSERASRHLALDGKTLRGTRRSGTSIQPAVHLLSLYAVTHHGTLTHQEVATKDHEIPGAITLLAGRDLGGCVLTADALHTQRDWCRKVRAQGGDYVLIAKNNQPGLLHDLALLFVGVWPMWLE